MIKAEVIGQELKLTGDITVADSVDYLTVKFFFSDDWQGYTKTAIFSNDTDTICVLLESGSGRYIGDNVCFVPYEIIKYPGFYVSVVGNNGVKRITAPDVFVKVQKSGYKEGRSPLEPTPDCYAQILQLSEQTLSVAQSVRDDADSGLFNGEKGDKGDKGDRGDNGAQGPQGPQGLQGQKGDTGKAFTISKVYTSVSQMNADYNNPLVAIGDFVIIDTGNVSDPDNSKLFIKGNTQYDFITDLSGATGIKGDKGDTGPQGVQGPQGIQGVKGDKGDTGNKGDKGDTGESAFLSKTEISGGTVSRSLSSDTFYHTTSAVTSLTINSFTKSLDNKLNEWAIDFTSGGSITVNVPDSVKWAVIEPAFEPNKTYLLSFAEIGSNILGIWTVI